MMTCKHSTRREDLSLVSEHYYHWSQYPSSYQYTPPTLLCSAVHGEEEEEMTSCERKGLQNIEEEDEQMVEFEGKLAKSNISLSALASPKDQIQHSITSLREDLAYCPKNQVLSLDREGIPQNAETGLKRVFAQESQASMTLEGETIYHPCISSHVYQRTKVEPGPSSLGHSSTVRQKSGIEGQKNWNTGLLDRGGDLKVSLTYVWP